MSSERKKPGKLLGQPLDMAGCNNKTQFYQAIAVRAR